MRNDRKIGRRYNCKFCVSKYHKNHYKLNKELIKIRIASNKFGNPLYNYGGTSEDYLKMLKKQKGRCLICKNKKKILVIDHCHICGLHNFDAVRGLLCRSCNSHSSFSLDNPKMIRRAYKYAIKHWNEYHT